MSIYEKTKCARALLYWAANNNGNEVYYLEDRMYAVADNGMVIILTADSYDEAIQKAKMKYKRPQGEWIETDNGTVCSKCGEESRKWSNFCPNCGAYFWYIPEV